jgi:hypothetical protein
MERPMVTAPMWPGFGDLARLLWPPNWVELIHDATVDEEEETTA